jgi:intein/homing endonuclease
MNELVECHSGFTYADRPVALAWEDQRLEIVEVLAGWRTPEKKLFRVRTNDGREFELAYNQATDEWQIKSL